MPCTNAGWLGHSVTAMYEFGSQTLPLPALQQRPRHSNFGGADRTSDQAGGPDGRLVAAPQRRESKAYPRTSLSRCERRLSLCSRTTFMLESLFASSWNRFVGTGKNGPRSNDGLDLGLEVHDGQTGQRRYAISSGNRTEHIAIAGKTGKGKSSLIYHLQTQDIRTRKGFAAFDHHGESSKLLLGQVAAEEQRLRADLSDRLVIIEPGDPEWSVGLNVLESATGPDGYIQISEFTQILRSRWHLDSLGARTEELLRNALHLLAENHLTLLELAPVLSNANFRTNCLARIQNPDVVSYFRERFDRRSETSQSTYREAILNKVSGFTSDVRFRHILGQQRSTFSILDAMDRGQWVILNLDKGRLGEHAATLGSLLLAKLKNALFARRRRHIFTVYCDEIQNLVTYDAGIDTLFSEARKFGISIVSANQFLDQYPPIMRAAVMAVGTHVCFQLSGGDAEKMAGAFDGGKHLAQLLKSLPKRHLVVKSGSHRPTEVVVPTISLPDVDYTDLYARCRQRWARRRNVIEGEIRARHRQVSPAREEVLNDWE